MTGPVKFQNRENLKTWKFEFPAKIWKFEFPAKIWKFEISAKIWKFEFPPKNIYKFQKLKFLKNWSNGIKMSWDPHRRTSRAGTCHPLTRCF